MASDAASWVTGQLLLVAGGRTERSYQYQPKSGIEPPLHNFDAGPDRTTRQRRPKALQGMHTTHIEMEENLLLPAGLRHGCVPFAAWLRAFRR